MLIKTLFLRLFEPDQIEITEIFQEIVNIHNGAIFKNGTVGDKDFGAKKKKLITIEVKKEITQL